MLLPFFTGSSAPAGRGRFLPAFLLGMAARSNDEDKTAQVEQKSQQWLRTHDLPHGNLTSASPRPHLGLTSVSPHLTSPANIQTHVAQEIKVAHGMQYNLAYAKFIGLMFRIFAFASGPNDIHTPLLPFDVKTKIISTKTLAFSFWRY